MNPETSIVCTENGIGEIWISGPTIAEGYWNNNEETRLSFNLTLNGSSDKKYLRSGDLGFLKDGELYITGRLKDLIIIRGKNHYPEDLEFNIQNSIAELKTNSGAAFTITHNSVEKLVIAQEIERTAIRSIDYSKLFSRIREVISDNHEIDVFSIVILKPGSIPMTSSGKIQRRKTKYQYLKNELSVIENWMADSDINYDSTEKVSSIPTEQSIKEWMIQWIMRNKRIERESIDLDTNIMSYGIDSLTAVTLETEISIHFGFQWHISSFILNPTINKLAEEGMQIYKESKEN